MLSIFLDDFGRVFKSTDRDWLGGDCHSSSSLVLYVAIVRVWKAAARTSRVGKGQR